MKNLFKRASLILLCLLLVLSFTACSGGDLMMPLLFDENHPVQKADSFVAAENDRYQLKWDRENLRIVLYDKVKDVNWSSTPQDYMEPRYDADGTIIKNNAKLETTLLVEYIETENYTVKTQNAHTMSLKTGKYALEKIDNGFKITYYFDKIGISVPVTYTLKKDGFAIGVDPTQICESGTNLLYRIDLAPFMCSTPNIADDSYLFYPSGSGALIYADRQGEISTYFNDSVYGEDAMYTVVSNSYSSVTENIKMPVFGAKNGQQAMMGIITQGADLAAIECDLYNQNLGHNGVFTSFGIRGRQTTTKAVGSSKTQYSDQYTSAPIEVTYYPLYDADADYVGMAKRYRQYLTEERGLEDRQEKASVSVSLIGGTEIPTSFLGVPTTDLYATTTVKQAETILTELQNESKLPIVAELFGFGKSGVDIGKPAGGLGLNRSIGSEKEVKALASTCDSIGVDLYFNYDLLYFNSNGSGLRKAGNGSSKAPSGLYGKKTGYYLGRGSASSELYYLVARDCLIDLAEKAVKHCAGMGVKGFSSENLTSAAYADYAHNRYFSKGNMANDVQTILKSAKENGMRIMGFDANDYAAALSDNIIEAPLTSNGFNDFDLDVPFYQIVFKGYVPMFGTALNTVTDQQKTILRLAETGCSLRYSLMNNFDVTLLNSHYQIFNTRLYADQKDQLLETVSQMTDFYEAISDAKITNHKLINDDVREVTYDNGVTVVVNYGKADCESSIGTVKAESFIYAKGGDR